MKGTKFFRDIGPYILSMQVKIVSFILSDIIYNFESASPLGAPDNDID